MEQKDLKALFEEFYEIKKYQEDKSKTTMRGYRATFDLFMEIMPTVTVDMLNSRTMTEFFKRLDTRKRRIGKSEQEVVGVKTSTKATYRSKLNAFFDWLLENQIITKSPFKGVEYPTPNYRDRKFLKKEVVERIISKAMLYSWQSNLLKTRNVAILFTLLSCGLRRGELAGLKVTDVDLKRNFLTVRAETSKSKFERTLPINSELKRALEDYLEEREKLHYKTEYLFVSANEDGKLTFDGLKHLVTKLVEISGEKFHLHQFRHTFGINLAVNNTHIAKMQQMMGHKDIRMTDTYLRQIPTSEMRSDVEHLRIANLM